MEKGQKRFMKERGLQNGDSKDRLGIHLTGYHPKEVRKKTKKKT